MVEGNSRSLEWLLPGRCKRVRLHGSQQLPSYRLHLVDGNSQLGDRIWARDRDGIQELPQAMEENVYG